MDMNAPMVDAPSAKSLLVELVLQMLTFVRMDPSALMDNADQGHGTAGTPITVFWTAAPRMVPAVVAGGIPGCRPTFQLMHAAANPPLSTDLMRACLSRSAVLEKI